MERDTPMLALVSRTTATTTPFFSCAKSRPVWVLFGLPTDFGNFFQDHTQLALAFLAQLASKRGLSEHTKQSKIIIINWKKG